MSEHDDAQRRRHDPHEPYEWREPGTADDEPQPKQPHAGNETVNHSLDDQGLEGLDSDELVLRRMLHQAVLEVEPRDGTLDHLRRAVPARRARKRQALVGMAAAALFVGTAVPALVHVSNSTGADVNPSVAGQASQAQGGAGQDKDPDGGESTAGGSSGKPEDRTPDSKKNEDHGKGAGTGTGTSSGAGTPATAAANTPACTSLQLGSATATTAVADSAGAVYGTFRVLNVSTTACTVAGPGTLGTTPQGAADAARISAVRHVSGDAAAALPDPSAEVSGLLLQPGSAYEVKFAFVPSETCPTSTGSTGGETGASPDPSPTGDTGDTGGTTTGTDSGVTSQLLTEDGTADGSIMVTNTADGGGPTVSTTVSNACAGTVYWTGVLTAS
ncbi:hypothetical protein ABZT03_12645 [Streptomyces sp. NPDC005574]|uniref:hypothetical protein n=1 Tax=Streptomyces sp. NPDC005574 TaxID=3156891 RepID=UPI0033B283B5